MSRQFLVKYRWTLEDFIVLSKRYGFTLRSDNEDNVRIFASLASLADYVATHRSQ